MKYFKLTVPKSRYMNAEVFINGTKPKNRTGNRSYGVYTYEAKDYEDKVTVELRRYVELANPHWFILSLLYFFVSIFGIFDTWPPKNPSAVNVKFSVKLDGSHTDTVLKFNRFYGSGRAVEIDSSAPFSEEENEIVSDETAAKRRKIIIRTRIAIYIALIAGAVAAAIIMIGG